MGVEKGLLKSIIGLGLLAIAEWLGCSQEKHGFWIVLPDDRQAVIFLETS